MLAFKVGDQIELEAFLNARSSAKFLKTSNNIKTQLSKGTHGEVLETKKMPSGNYGIKLKIDNGPRRGESYWLYYNVKKPNMKLFDQEKREQQKPSSEQIPQAKSATLTKEQEGIRDSDEAELVNAATTANLILNNKAITQVGKLSKKSRCPPEISEVSSNVSEQEYSESDVVVPFREVATSPLLPGSSCVTVDSGWEQCKKSGTKDIEGFKLRNSGPNNIVKTNEYYINREMSFEFDDRARSDMKLMIVDAPDDTTSHMTWTVMLFFPRSVLPAVKKIGNELEVTLPNKEIVRYNAKTKEVIGGVFTEGPMRSDPKNKNKAVPADISYTGNGVMIRADKSGDLPYGDIELRDGSSARSTTIATVSKKGHKDCKIPSKDIWYTDENKGGNTFIKPELQNDKGVDAFIKLRCGFSLY